MAEAGNQGYGGQIAAGSVIMNRVGGGGYGNGLRGVILQPGQFSAWNSLTGYAGGEQGQDMPNIRPSAEVYKATDDLLSGRYTDPTGGALNYYNDKVSNPNWGEARSGGEWRRIGDHLFGTAGSAQAVGGGAMAALGRQSNTGGQRMATQPTQRQGILDALGMQKQDRNVQGDTARPFYQRDDFKDTMGKLAVGLNSLTLRPDQNLAANVRANRQERQTDQARNKTVEYLRANGRADLASMVEQGMISGQDAAGQLLAKPDVVKPTTDIQNYEYYSAQELAAGRDPLSIADWSIMDEQASVPGPDSGKFDEQSAKFIVEEAGDLATAGQSARRSLRQIDALETALSTTSGGTITGIQSWLGGLGISTEGLNEIQLADAIISQLVPGQRPPGSGTMSDADLALFKKSLPRLINTPGGNAMIISTMRAIANYDVQMGDISRQLLLREINPRQAYDAYGAILDPLSAFAAGTGGGGGAAIVPAPGDIVDGYRFKGGNPALQSNWEAI